MNIFKYFMNACWNFYTYMFESKKITYVDL